MSRGGAGTITFVTAQMMTNGSPRTQLIELLSRERARINCGPEPARRHHQICSGKGLHYRRGVLFLFSNYNVPPLSRKAKRNYLLT
ncbi:hypothetical protein EVAR_16782_1 [Eumeta japonica]|uniref:Uncharacterized protein n=1 Tax=Eumeta variegata TaxID=151549 RepID=A0A4C1UKX9_EUMVA|nr:hypothetical protein EVAR_16782_1 [Eumeta japonica]